MDYKKLIDYVPEWAKLLYERDPSFLELETRYGYFLVLPESGKRYRELVEWCNQYVGVEEQDWEYLILNIWAFTNEQDLIAFKLRWM